MSLGFGFYRWRYACVHGQAAMQMPQNVSEMPVRCWAVARAARRQAKASKKSSRRCRVQLSPVGTGRGRRQRTRDRHRNAIDSRAWPSAAEHRSALGSTGRLSRTARSPEGRTCRSSRVPPAWRSSCEELGGMRFRIDAFVGCRGTDRRKSAAADQIGGRTAEFSSSALTLSYSAWY